MRFDENLRGGNGKSVWDCTADQNDKNYISSSREEQERRELLPLEENEQLQQLVSSTPYNQKATMSIGSTKIISIDSDASESSQTNRKRRDEKDASKVTTMVEKTTHNDESPWTLETHRAFVEAIYSVGMSHASPAVIMEYMTLLDPTDHSGGRRRKSDHSNSGHGSHKERTRGVTNERVKSHLQKYRINGEKSKNEFLQEYDAWMRKGLTIGRAANPARTGGNASLSLLHPSTVVQLMGGNADPIDSSELLGGERAAWLSYATLAEEYTDREPLPAPLQPFRDACNHQEILSSTPQLPQASNRFIAAAGSGHDSATGTKSKALHQVQPTLENFRQGSDEYLRRFAGTSVPYPVLSESERSSSLGMLIRHVLDLFLMMTQYLIRQRLDSAGFDSENQGATSNLFNVTLETTKSPPPAVGSDQQVTSDHQNETFNQNETTNQQPIPTLSETSDQKEASKQPEPSKQSDADNGKESRNEERKRPAEDDPALPFYDVGISPSDPISGRIPSQWRVPPAKASKTSSTSPPQLPGPPLDFDERGASQQASRKRKKLNSGHHLHPQHQYRPPVPMPPVHFLPPPTASYPPRHVHPQEPSGAAASSTLYLESHSQPRRRSRQRVHTGPIADEVMAAVVHRALQAEAEEERERPSSPALAIAAAVEQEHNNHSHLSQIPIDSMTHDSNQSDLGSLGNVFDDAYDDDDDDDGHEHSKTTN